MSIYDEIKAERQRQDEKWGEQNHPILDPNLVHLASFVMCDRYDVTTEEDARYTVEQLSKNGTLTFTDIARKQESEMNLVRQRRPHPVQRTDSMRRCVRGNG